MKTVLIADDSLFMRTFLKKRITEHNDFKIVEATNGLEAIMQFKKVHPDLTLLDITMPKVNGLTALKEIIKINPNARVIMCSALGSQMNIIEAINIGAKDFIVKPNFNNLNEIINNNLNG
ncbi:response regulator [Ornithinibacillus sp. L9]|uniref:Response regulator n=1 Tax=Ornithinibacillus caprae TaxID=2678566 RepID=A0A6N8FDB0_9BACI|nr:response regulator [Ornithinibacillus caprae]MUK87533.1 response regulator [Ornithinibacillus caprae]